MNEIITNDYQYVDLGLPSGTLWAACNVGAQRPTEIGLYFQWGDTKGYKKNCEEQPFSQYSYKFTSHDVGVSRYTKYNPIDNKFILDLEDDAAHAIMGGSWRMPTSKQFEELSNNVKFHRFDKFVILKSKRNNRQMILPFNGYYINNTQYSCGNNTLLWGCERENINGRTEYVSYLCGSGTGGIHTFTDRYFGFNVRGVINTK